MKKLIKILLSLFFIIVIAIASFGVYFIVMIKDPTDNTLDSVKENNYPLLYLVNREIDNSTKSIDTTNIMDFELDEENLNEFLYAIMSQIKIPSVTIKGAYSTFIDNGGIKVEVPLSVYGIDSCLKADLKIESLNNGIKFTFLNAMIGKFNATSSTIRNFVLKNISSKSIEDSLEKNHIYCNVSLDELSITFSKDNIIDTLQNLLKDDQNVNVYSILTDFMLTHPEILSLEFGQNKEVGFDFNIADILYNEERDDILRAPLDLIKCKNETLNTANINYTNISSVFTYNVKGYDALSEEDAAKVDELGLSKKYKGVKEDNKITMLDVLNAQAPSSLTEWNQTLLNQELSLKVNEDNFASIFSSMGFIGTSFAFGIDNSSLAYLTFESLSVDISDNAFFINMIINLSGKRIILKAEFSSEKTETSTITATLNALYFGSIKLEDKYIPILLEYLNKILEKEEWFTVDIDKSNVLINLDQLINNNSSFATIKDVKKNTSMEFDHSPDGNGYLKMTYSLI